MRCLRHQVYYFCQHLSISTSTPDSIYPSFLYTITITTTTTTTTSTSTIPRTPISTTHAIVPWSSLHPLSSPSQQISEQRFPHWCVITGIDLHSYKRRARTPGQKWTLIDWPALVALVSSLTSTRRHHPKASSVCLGRAALCLSSRRYSATVRVGCSGK
ncbi:hypothetical protein GGP41_003948 [Bipolaris sorokiniana]|uniref:Uncharacterized protein n=1 Tax=Cochliobolus sativus TaxID=45130 RepID=A0A8H5ZL87_COCSA|nr:hypothetical protein GGP41_003948 [Bipolaris sorokiniana]